MPRDDLKGDRRRNPQASVVDQVARGASFKLRRDLLSSIGASIVSYIDTGTGVVARTLQSIFRDHPIQGRSFGIVADGVTDDSTALLNAVNAHFTQGRKLELPAGIIKVTSQILMRRDDWIEGNTSFAPGPNISGAGLGKTILDWLGTEEDLFDLAPNHDFVSTFKGILGAKFSNMTIRCSDTTGKSNAGAFRLRSVFNLTLDDVHITGLKGGGVTFDCLTGDFDGSHTIRFIQTRIDSCSGWGLSCAAAEGHNEISFLNTDGLVVQACGTPEDKDITSFTAANPGIFTCTGHGFADDTQVYVEGTDKSAVNTGTAERRYRLKSLSDDTFKLQTGSDATVWTDLNTTSIGAGTGGRVWPVRPSSGGIKWKGQVANFGQGGVALCYNAGVWIVGEDGLPQDVTFSQFTVENNGLSDILATGVRGLTIHPGLHFHHNSSLSPQPHHFGLVLDGTNNQVSTVNVNSPLVRNTVNEDNFTQYLMMGAKTAPDTIKVRDTDWKADGWTGQRRFSSGFLFDHVPFAAEFRLVDNVTWRLGPNPLTNAGQRGNKVPIRRRAGTNGNVTTGEWTGVSITSLSLAFSTGLDGSPLANSTTYNVYLRETAPNVFGLVASTTGTVFDPVSGYEVKSDDFSHLYIARVRTGTGVFETTQLGYLNALPMAPPIPGAPTWLFFNEANGNLYLKHAGTRPSNAVDGARIFRPSIEHNKTSVAPGTIAAGGVHLETITSGVTATVGEPVMPSINVSTAGLILTAAVTAANTITVTYFNPTGSGIDPGSHTLRALLTRRV